MFRYMKNTVAGLVWEVHEICESAQHSQIFVSTRLCIHIANITSEADFPSLQKLDYGICTGSKNFVHVI